MKAAGYVLSLLAAGVCASLSGCLASQSRLTASETQNRVLAAQNQALIAESANLKQHARETEDRLLQAEQELARMQEQTDRKGGRFSGSGRGRQLPTAVGNQLLALSQRYPNLHFDPETGVSKFDVDVLFNSGQAELTPPARAMLLELGQILQLSEAKDLKVMVVGHTDNQRITGRATRDKFANNFHLSTGRALAVADLLRSQGLTDQRIGVAGFGSHEPVVSNENPTERQKNRRVEIYVMAPDVPVVGWADTGSGTYY